MRRRVTITESDGVATVRGWQARELLTSAGIRPTFVHGGWMIDAHRVPDLLAALERRGIAAEVSGRHSPAARCSMQSVHTSSSESTDLDVPLWPDGGES